MKLQNGVYNISSKPWIDEEFIEAKEKAKSEKSEYYYFRMYNGGTTIKCYKPSIATLFKKRFGDRFTLINGKL